MWYMGDPGGGGTSVALGAASGTAGNSANVDTGSSVQFRWGTDGNYTLVSGNLVQGTAAKGVNFTANTGAAGMTSQLLNWYEEGTWTPTDGSGAGLTFTGTSSNCFYTRVGRLVTCIFNLVYPSTANVSNASLVGLPFISLVSTNNVAGGYTTFTDAGFQISLLVGQNDTSVSFWKNNGTAISNADLSGKILRGVITYFS